MSRFTLKIKEDDRVISKAKVDSIDELEDVFKDLKKKFR